MHAGKFFARKAAWGQLNKESSRSCSIGNQSFSVGLVDQLFQPTRNPAELVENDGYRPLSQS